MSQRVRLVLVREEIYKERAKERMREGGGDRCSEEYKKAGHHRGDDPISAPDNWTLNRLAKEAGASHTTIHRVRVIERDAPVEAKEAIMR